MDTTLWLMRMEARQYNWMLAVVGFISDQGAIFHKEMLPYSEAPAVGVENTRVLGSTNI